MSGATNANEIPPAMMKRTANRSALNMIGYKTSRMKLARKCHEADNRNDDSESQNKWTEQRTELLSIERSHNPRSDQHASHRPKQRIAGRVDSPAQLLVDRNQPDSDRHQRRSEHELFQREMWHGRRAT